MPVPFKDPSRAADLLVDLLDAEGLNPDDRGMLSSARRAFTDAQMWLYRQRSWWFLRRRGTFESLPTAKVHRDSAAAATTLYVDEPETFAADETLVVNEGGDREERVTVSSIDYDAATITLEANLANTHTAAQGDTVRRLRPIKRSATRTRVDASSAANGTTLNVQETGSFSAGDLVVIEPGTVRAEVRRISSITGTSSGSFTLYGNLDFTHTSGLVVKVIEDELTYVLNRVNRGSMIDLGRVTKITVDGSGALEYVNYDTYESSFESAGSGAPTAGDLYTLFGEPLQLAFLKRPIGNALIRVWYDAIPPRVWGAQDIIVPREFHAGLLHLARMMFLNVGEKAVAASPIITQFVDQLAAYSPTTADAAWQFGTDFGGPTGGQRYVGIRVRNTRDDILP